MPDDNFTESLLALIKKGEGCIEYMYLDTVGKVTVGVGNMLPNSTAAQSLTFLQRIDNTPATLQQIADEFGVIAQQQAGRLASSYKTFTKLYMPTDAIDILLEKRVDEFVAGLQKDFPDYEQYPDPAKMALIDMVFNLGNAGLITHFPSLTRAARAQDWNECANQCRRVGIADSRNAETRELFLEAVNA